VHPGARILQPSQTDKVLPLVGYREVGYSGPVIRAILFDFNGVIADDETPHFVCFQQALAEARLTLTKDEYYGLYLGMDERICARLLLERRDGTCDEAQLSRIADRKADLFRAHTASHKPLLFPGVAEFVRAAQKNHRLAIASGGRKAQIHAALAGTPIEGAFEVIVSAEDCLIGKPDPAIYLLTRKRLNDLRPSHDGIAPSECLVLEDSVAGIRSAKAAGMRVIGVATTYPIEKLHEADSAIQSLQGMTPESALRRLT
jgi:HAD superfamily hydrolase (TIGR01509 family)